LEVRTAVIAVSPLPPLYVGSQCFGRHQIIFDVEKAVVANIWGCDVTLTASKTWMACTSGERLDFTLNSEDNSTDSALTNALDAVNYMWVDPAMIHGSVIQQRSLNPD